MKWPTRIIALLLITTASSAQPAPAPAHALSVQPAPSAHDAALLKLLDEDLEAQKRRSPLEASRRGDSRFDALLPDVSPAAQAAWANDARARLVQLGEIDESALSDQNRVSAALLRWELNQRIAAEPFAFWQMPVTQQDGPQRELPQIPDFQTFTTEKQFSDYLARLEAIPAYLDSVTANLRAGLASGRTPPKVVMATVAAQALAHATEESAKDPSLHALYKPFAGREGPLAQRAKDVIAQRVVPAFRAFGEFLRDEYVPACRDTIAARDLPDGQALYNFQIRDMTTTDLTSDQIHAIGLSEVARIRDEMFAVIARSDYPRKNELQGDDLFRAFVQFLRTDPRFYHTSADQLLAGYRDIAKRVDAEMPRLFGTLPRLPYGIREMPRFIAASAPTAYYYQGSIENGVPGYFIANTVLLDQRPKYEMISLTLHEAVPGHHHQVALAQELEVQGLPEWRTWAGYTIFIEGWGLYSERLGLEMGDDPRSPSNPDGHGMFTDPYDDFGRLSYEMWRAMRLVVDTGMHALGWSRQQAIDYMLANSALSAANIEREVDRYIAWPGQALAYKLGELKIRALREEAERTLGDRFDVRGFHDALLLSGAVPLDVMEAQVRRWIAEQAAASAKPTR